MSSADTTKNLWLTFTHEQRNAFLKEHFTSEINAAVESMNHIDSKGAVCLVCVAENLNSNNSHMQDFEKITKILNRSMGKTWGKPSKQTKHSTTAKHEKSHFCTLRSKVSKMLHIWKLGLLPIGGIYYSGTDKLSLTDLKSWLCKNYGINQNIEKAIVDHDRKPQKRILGNPFKRAMKKPKPTDLSCYQSDPIGRLEAILPQLEKIAKVHQSAEDEARHEIKKSIARIVNSSHTDSFETFLGENGAVSFNNQERKVYCKQCHNFTISHSISRKGDKFYVNASQPCSFPLTGRGYHKYNQGRTRQEFFKAHENDSPKYKFSQWKWACGLSLDENRTPMNFLSHHQFAAKHLRSHTHLISMIW